MWRSLGRTWIDDGLNWRMLDRFGLGHDRCCADWQVLNAVRLCKNKKEGGSTRAAPVAALMPKSNSF